MPESPESEDQEEFERQMAMARQIMDERWVTLRALALSDQFPELDAKALVEMAEQQRQQGAKPSS